MQISLLKTRALRPRPRITASRWRARRDGIIPIRMKVVALDIQGGHLGVTDLDALRIGPRVEFTTHRQTVFVVVATINSTTINRLVSGLPRQFSLMWQNRLDHAVSPARTRSRRNRPS